PAAIMTLFLVLFSYKLAKKLTSEKLYAFISSLIMATSFYIVASARDGQWDIYTHGFMVICIYLLYLFFTEETHKYRNALLAGLFFGCSFLSKGPVSMYALLLPFLIAFGIVYKYKNFKTRWLPLVAFLAVAFIVSAWWHWYTLKFDPAAAEITKKETTNWISYEIKPFYYYWSFFTQSGIWTIPAFISLLYPYLKNRVSNLKSYQFSLLWTIFAVVLLSIIPEKKSRYLMPVLLPLAINIGFYMDYLIRRFKHLKDKRETLPVYFNFGLIALIALAFPLIAYLFLDEQLQGFWLRFIIASIVSFSIGVFIIFQLKKKNIRSVFGLTVLFFVTLFLTAVPLSKAMIAKSYKPITNLKQEHFKVYSFNYVSPELIWQYGDKIPPIKLDDGTYDFPKEDKFGMVVIGISPEDWAILQSQYSIEEVDSFDLNTVSKEEKNYNGRLTYDYYVLSKN
ncbi:MAG: glycosyltransferase family 39 protein, partial [Gelidibacter sp.]|nr:glycosyltransferase family 39 protein [Gelidibacter sp.]